MTATDKSSLQLLKTGDRPICKGSSQLYALEVRANAYLKVGFRAWPLALVGYLLHYH